MPAVITARRRTSWIGPTRNVRSVPWPSILLDLRPRRRSRKAGTAAMAVLTGSRPQRPTAIRPKVGLLVVDGHFKTQFESDAAAQKFAKELLTNYPMLHLEIYNASTKGRTLVRR